MTDDQARRPGADPHGVVFDELARQHFAALGGPDELAAARARREHLHRLDRLRAQGVLLPAEQEELFTRAVENMVRGIEEGMPQLMQAFDNIGRVISTTLQAMQAARITRPPSAHPAGRRRPTPPMIAALEAKRSGTGSGPRTDPHRRPPRRLP